MAAADPESPTLPTVTELPAGLRLIAEGKGVAQRFRGDGTFYPIDFPERRWQESNYDLRYHVFTSENDRVIVPAISAIDAISKSGIDRPFKIVRGRGSDETIGTVVRAGRLVPSDQPGVDAGAAESEAQDATEDKPGAETEPTADADGEGSGADNSVAGADADSEVSAAQPETEETS